MSDEELRPDEDEETEEQYETTAEEATGFEKQGDRAPLFNRKKVLLTLSIGLSVVVGGGLLLNVNKGSGRSGENETSTTQAARTPRDFLESQLNRSLSRTAAEPLSEELSEETMVENTEEKMPVVTWDESPASRLMTPPPAPARTPPPPAPSSSPGRAPAREEAPTHFASPLTPRVEGFLLPFSAGNVSAPASAAGMTNASNMTAPNMAGVVNPAGAVGAEQQAAPGAPGEGYFLGENTLWTGTVIPSVLVTGINTDLPGIIIARVTENIYDSRTGKSLLIPQGTILQARYNNSVSYAQKRVQIAWDLLTRPDGFQLELGGMGGVDKKGMSGQEAVYHENWFEYLKAAGLITMFTVANSKMAEETEKYTNDEVSGGIAQANAGFVSQTGSAVVSRAMNIQPTLTVESGTVVNVMLNRTIRLPEMKNYPVLKKYFLN